MKFLNLQSDFIRNLLIQSILNFLNNIRTFLQTISIKPNNLNPLQLFIAFLLAILFNLLDPFLNTIFNCAGFASGGLAHSYHNFWGWGGGGFLGRGWARELVHCGEDCCDLGGTTLKQGLVAL